jgi:nitrite reductase/ring-hydroxylating ferredoxin subunit
VTSETTGFGGGPGPAIAREVSYETYVNLIRQLDELVSVFENHPDPATREQAVALLSGMDMLHHEALGRLVGLLRNHGGSEFLDRAFQDPVIQTLFGLYGLAELNLPEEEEPKPAPAAFVPLERLTVNGEPVAGWTEVGRVEDFPPGAVRAAEVDGMPLLLLNVRGDVCGYRNACPVDGGPLDAGSLVGNELVCPRHGCRFDARTGTRRDGGEGRLQVVPVAVRGSSIRLKRMQRGSAPPFPSSNKGVS